jgi:hypothetical protein
MFMLGAAMCAEENIEFTDGYRIYKRLNWGAAAGGVHRSIIQFVASYAPALFAFTRSRL